MKIVVEIVAAIILLVSGNYESREEQA